MENSTYNEQLERKIVEKAIICEEANDRQDV